MAELDVGYIVVIVLCSVLVVLLLVFVLTCVLLLRKKRLLCFKNREYTRPLLYSEREIQKSKKRKKRSAVQKKKKKTRIYQSISKGLRFPKRDPFASNYLENPMVDMEELEADWTNPAFDEFGAQMHDAVVTIQSWFRMIRYNNPAEIQARSGQLATY